MAEEEAEETKGVRLVINFNVEERIEITELTCSFNAVKSLYSQFLLDREDGQDSDLKANLYIAKITDNCILVQFALDLIDKIDPATLEAQFNTFRDFIDSINAIINQLIEASGDGTVDPKIPHGKTKAILDLLKSIKNSLKPELTINATKNGKKDSESQSVNLSGKNIPRIIKGAKRVIKSAEQVIEASNKATYKEEPKTVLLHFTRINTGNKGCAGFFGIIKDINDAEFPIDEFRIRVTKRFSDRIKKDIKDKNLNQVTDSYDAIVLERYKDGELKSYKIINLIKIVPNTHS